MASYFEEHNCQELPSGHTPNHYLDIARLIVDGGWSETMGLSFEQLFPDKQVAPPASKAAVEALRRFSPGVEDVKAEQQCPVCIAVFEATSECVAMPCKHHFHATCILPWLSKTNSCPVCRHELITDDATYETFRQQKKRRDLREQDIQELHDSMFN